MKIKTLTALSALVFLLSLPLAAQTMDEATPEAEPLQAQPAQPESESVAAADEQPADEGFGADSYAASDDPAQSGEEASLGETEAAEYDDEESLPQTASPLALLAVIGAVGAGAATGVRRVRRR